jgi:hypothetical protein
VRPREPRNEPTRDRNWEWITCSRALDMGEQWDRQREHQRGGVADFAGILERAIGVCERGLGIAKRPQSYRSMG